jgi:hypothetical protein
VVALGGRLALASEHLGGEQERAAVDGRLIQVLAEGDHGAVHDLHPGPLKPGGPVGGGVDEHGRRTGPKQPVQRCLSEHVIGGDQHKQRLAHARDLALDRGERRAVAVLPPVGVHGPDPAAPKAADDGRDRPGVVADHDQDPLQPAGQQGPHRPLDQAQPTQPQQRLGATPGDRLEPLGPARGQHHAHPRQLRQRRIGLDHLRPRGERDERIGRSLRCLRHAPTPRRATG